MTTSLPLANLTIHADPTGLVRIGDLTLPAWMAADVALRIAEAANSALPDAEGRRSVRETGPERSSNDHRGET